MTQVWKDKDKDKLSGKRKEGEIEMKKRQQLGIAAMLLCILTVAPMTVQANGFPSNSNTPSGQTEVGAGVDIVGEAIERHQPQQGRTSNSNSVQGNILGEVADSLAIEDTIASTMHEPWVQSIVEIVGRLISISVILIVLWMLVGTGLDIMYIMVEPSRNLLHRGQQQQGRGGMGMPGGMGLQGGGAASTAMLFISIEARRLVQEAEATAQGGGMGGIGGGMGMMGGGAQQPQAQPKHPIRKYIHLRAKAFIALMIAIVLLMFNTFIFDIGTQLANILIYLIIAIFDIIVAIF